MTPVYSKLQLTVSYDQHCSQLLTPATRNPIPDSVIVFSQLRTLSTIAPTNMYKQVCAIIGASLSEPHISELTLEFCLFGTYVVPKLCTMFYICGLVINFSDHVHVCILCIIYGEHT